MMARNTEDILPMHVVCDFCGRTKEKAGKLVRSPFGVHICYDCAVAAAVIINDARQKEVGDIINENAK